MNQEATGREICYLHFLIMKHKQSPEVFLPEKKKERMREASNNKQLYYIS